MTKKTNTEDYLRMYRQMVRIRTFEDNANKLYLSAKMPGLTHMYSGEEAVAVGICEALGANQYISAEGSRGYIEEEDLFSVRNIRLDYHEYRHPEYRQQFGEFVPYLSALDLLFNEGPDSSSIVRKGRA